MTEVEDILWRLMQVGLMIEDAGIFQELMEGGKEAMKKERKFLEIAEKGAELEVGIVLRCRVEA